MMSIPGLDYSLSCKAITNLLWEPMSSTILYMAVRIYPAKVQQKSCNVVHVITIMIMIVCIMDNQFLIWSKH